MEYQKPEVTALAPAIDAIQNGSKLNPGSLEGVRQREIAGAYEDWE